MYHLHDEPANDALVLHLPNGDIIFADLLRLPPSLASKSVKHTPGGADHDQQSHAGGRGSITAGEAQTLAAAVKERGGFTYQPLDDTSPTKGWSIAVLTGNERAIPDGNRPEADLSDDIFKYLQDHSDVFDDPEVFVGGWHDVEKGLLYLDTPKVLDISRDAAVEVARQHNQEGIYNLATGETVIVKDESERRGATKAAVSKIKATMARPTSTSDADLRTLANKIAKQITKNEGRKAFCPTGPGGGIDNSCSPKRDSAGAGAADGVIPGLAEAKATILEHTGYSEAQIKSALLGSCDPHSYPENAKARARITGSLYLSGNVVENAVLHLKTDKMENTALIAALGGGKNSKEHFRETPRYDLQVLSKIVDHNKPIPGEAVCYMHERRIEMGSDARLGSYRHELGHAIRSMLGGDSPSTKTQITKAIANEFEIVKAKVKANPIGAQKKLDHDWYENHYGVAGQRSIDNWEENFAEHYRLYGREIYRDRYEGGGGKYLAQYRERHPGWAKIWDAYYTAALIGQESQ